jgi:hypothetical protein
MRKRLNSIAIKDSIPACSIVVPDKDKYRGDKLSGACRPDQAMIRGLLMLLRNKNPPGPNAMHERRGAAQ